MAAHRYWRINMTAGAGGAYAFAEIQFRTTAGTSLPFSGGTASAADVFGGTPGANDASKAADSNISTLYGSNNKTAPQWWMYDYGATAGNWIDPVEIAITARNDGNFNQAPSAFAMEFSDNNSTWTQLALLSAVWASAGQVQFFPLVVSGAFASWNPADLSGITLSNGNTVATGVGGGGGVRSTPSFSAGKYYLEHTWTNISTNSITSGIALGTASLTTPTTGWARVARTSGNIFINNVDTGSSISGGSAVSNASVIGIAVDFTAQLIWFRLGAAGQWNGSGTANPATAAGGLSIAAISSGALCASMNGGTSDAVTANFGANAFTGAVPAGFISGFPTGGGGAAAAQARAMVLA